MNDQDRQSLFVVLKALDRYVLLLQQGGAIVPSEVASYLTQVWHGLASGRMPRPSRRLEKVIDAAVKDEQDLDAAGMVVNFFYYALSDLLLYGKEGDSQSLAAAEESILDAYDYIAGQGYLQTRLGGKAAALTDEDEKRIAEDPTFAAEIAQQGSDRDFAKSIPAWDGILSSRSI